MKKATSYQGRPFPLIVENKMTPQNELEILDAAKEAKQGKNVTQKMTPKEAIAYLNLL